MERNNVLLKITDLRQYFPVGKKKGLYVKANDGISLNIYEGETVGLVGESGCGKSTFGRTLLQLYRQTDGKTMYYGASRDELAPEYIEKTIRHLPHGLHELAALEKKRDEMQKVYDAADEQKRLHMHNDLTAAKKAANDAYLNIVNVIGGFITASSVRVIPGMVLHTPYNKNFEMIIPQFRESGKRRARKSADPRSEKFWNGRNISPAGASNKRNSPGRQIGRDIV